MVHIRAWQKHQPEALFVDINVYVTHFSSAGIKLHYQHCISEAIDYIWQIIRTIFINHSLYGFPLSIVGSQEMHYSKAGSDFNI